MSVEEIELAAIRDEGYDPEDPAVIVALARVKELLRSRRFLASAMSS